MIEHYDHIMLLKGQCERAELPFVTLHCGSQAVVDMRTF